MGSIEVIEKLPSKSHDLLVSIACENEVSNFPREMRLDDDTYVTVSSGFQDFDRVGESQTPLLFTGPSSPVLSYQLTLVVQQQFLHLGETALYMMGSAQGPRKCAL